MRKIPLARASGDRAAILAGSQVRRQCFLGVEYSPLKRLDRELSCVGDLAIFQLFDEKQLHHLAFSGIQEEIFSQPIRIREPGKNAKSCGLKALKRSANEPAGVRVIKELVGYLCLARDSLIDS
jgi:hypothetical protein